MEEANASSNNQTGTDNSSLEKVLCSKISEKDRIRTFRHAGLHDTRPCRPNGFRKVTDDIVVSRQHKQASVGVPMNPYHISGQRY